MLILLGDGVVANVTLNKSGMKGAGSIQITFAWGLAVMVPAFIFGAASGASFNPALTLALAIDGSFDYNYKTGKMTFRMTAVYLDSLFSKGLFAYMLACAFYTVDKYNDKFLMIAKGFLPIEDFFGED